MTWVQVKFQKFYVLKYALQAISISYLSFFQTKKNPCLPLEHN